MPLERADRLQRALEIDGEDFGHDFRRALGQAGGLEALGDGHQDVDGPHATQRRLAKQFEIGRPRHVAGDDDDASRRQLRQLIEPAAISRRGRASPPR